MNNVKFNKWARSDVDIETLVKVLRIDKLAIPYVKKLLDNPTSNAYTLLKRRELMQNLHKEFIESIGSESFSDIALYKLNNHANFNILWFFTKHSDETTEYYNNLFFGSSIIEKHLNSLSLLLHISTISKIYLAPLMLLIGPIISALIPIIAMKWYGLNISYTHALQVIWFGITYQIRTALNAVFNGKNPIIILGILVYLVFYFWGIWTTVQTSLEKYAVLKEIKEKVDNIRNFLIDMQLIITDSRNKYFHNESVMNDIHTLLNYIGVNNSISTGTYLKVFRELFSLSINDTNDDCWILKKLENIIEYSREISGTLCLARLLRIPGYCLPSWYSNKKDNRDVPVINVKKLCHPLLTDGVQNDILISKNLLITGPNQSGKSTFMRSLLTASWMAQTIGIVCAESYSATPFNIIYSYIGLTDEINQSSLFQAEMNAFYEYLTEIKKGGTCICFFDELFTSTNHEEGVSAALAVCSSFKDYTNAITVISSHFTELHSLNSSDFDKVCLGIILDEEKLKFTYKIEPGVSNNRVALRLMKEKGYNKELVSEAYKNLERLFSYTTKFKKVNDELEEEYKENKAKDAVNSSKGRESIDVTKELEKERVEKERIEKERVEKERGKKDKSRDRDRDRDREKEQMGIQRFSENMGIRDVEIMEDKEISLYQ